MRDDPKADSLPVAFLYLEDGPRVFRVHLDRPRILIGRAEDNDVVIRDERVEPHHALLYFEDGHYVLTAATEGPVLVNSKRLDRPRTLYNGDSIDVRGTKMTFIRVPHTSDTVLQIAICTGGEPPWFALLNRPVIEIGQKRGDLLVADDFVADPHCVIENFCAGSHYVVGIDQERGTYVNGERVTERRPLRDGDVLRVGATDLVVRFHGMRALPAPDVRIPLHDIERYNRRPEDLETDQQVPIVTADQAGRSVREILESHERQSDPDRMFRLNDFDEDDEDRFYYLPEHKRKAKPSSLDEHLDEAPQSGHTMLIPVTKSAKAKKDRYYLPDKEEQAPRPAPPPRSGSDDETRTDVPRVRQQKKRDP